MKLIQFISRLLYLDYFLHAETPSNISDVLIFTIRYFKLQRKTLAFSLDPNSAMNRSSLPSFSQHRLRTFVPYAISGRIPMHCDTDAIFIVCQLQEKYLARNKELPDLLKHFATSRELFWKELKTYLFRKAYAPASENY